jgi:hypothetical protein
MKYNSSILIFSVLLYAVAMFGNVAMSASSTTTATTTTKTTTTTTKATTTTTKATTTTTTKTATTTKATTTTTTATTTKATTTTIKATTTATTTTAATSDYTVDDNTINLTPKVTLTVNEQKQSITVKYNDSLTIDWDSENVTLCTNPYVAAWPNPDKPFTGSTSGEIVIDNATTTQIFNINCKQTGGFIFTSSVIVYVEKQPAPTISVTADDKADIININYGSSTSLVWDSTDTSTSSCSLLVATSTDKTNANKVKVPISPSGQMDSDNIYTSKVFTVTCQNSSGVASSSILVNVATPKDSNKTTDVLDSVQDIQCIDIKNNMKYGVNDKDTKNEVSLLQDFLSKNGFYKNKKSGFLGYGTVNAIVLFQKKQGLDSTGFFGPMTRAKVKQLTCKNT